LDGRARVGRQKKMLKERRQWLGFVGGVGSNNGFGLREGALVN